MAYDLFVEPIIDWDSSKGVADIDFNRIEGNILALLKNASKINLLINGGFDLWQRSNSRSISGGGSKSYYTADRWFYKTDGATTAVTESRQSFSAGQTSVPGNPLFYHRTAVTAHGGDMTLNDLSQQIEDVRTCAGETVTFSFWAKSDTAGKTIKPVLVQNFGTGGSASVNHVGDEIALTTSWKRYSATFNVSSISGKTIGTVDTHFLGVCLKQQLNSNCVIDVANAKLERGQVATPWVSKGIQQEFQDCLRFYECISMNAPFAPVFCYSSTMAMASIAYSPKRIIPIVGKSGGSYTIYSNVGGDVTVTEVSYPYCTNRHARATLTVGSAVLVGGDASMLWCTDNLFTADAEFYA